MTLRDYVSKAGEKFRSYFSRRDSVEEPNEVVNQDERGRNAQVGYLQKRTWFDKFLDGTGKLFKYLGFIGATATVVGGIALGTQYVRGGWPFKEVKDNEYVITQNTITEKPARPLQQGVNSFISPFVRTVKDAGGLEVKITGKIQSQDTPRFAFISRDGAVGKISTQYNYQVSSPEGAAKVHWDYGGLANAHESLDNIIERELTEELAKVDARGVTGKTRIATEGERIYSDKGYKIAKGGEEIDYLVQAEHKANESLRKERSGIVVTNFAISEPEYDQDLKDAWKRPQIERSNLEAEQFKAQQKVIRANAEAREAEIQAGATAKAITEKYFPIGQAIAQAAGQPELAGQYTMQLVMADNNQQMVNTASSNGGRIIFAPGLFGGNQAPQAGVTIQNVGTATPNNPTKRV